MREVKSSKITKHHDISKTLIRYNTKVNCLFIEIGYLLHKLEFQTSTPLTNEPSEERILNIGKSSGTTSVEVKGNVNINYRPITTKLPAQVFGPATPQTPDMALALPERHTTPTE